VFYLPLDATTTAAIAGGDAQSQHLGRELDDSILMHADLMSRQFSPGKVGGCCDLSVAGLAYQCAGNFRADEGACGFWICPKASWDDPKITVGLFAAADWGKLYKNSRLYLSTATDTGSSDYDCSSPEIKEWKAGEWHHVVVCWSREENSRRIYLDGKSVSRRTFPSNKALKEGPLCIGAAGRPSPASVASGKMDEVAIWNQPLDDATVAALYALGQAGQPLWKVDAPPPGPGPETSTINVLKPKAPSPPRDSAPPVESGPGAASADTDVVALDGWWEFLPSPNRLRELPAEGWGLARVPGFWAGGEHLLGPDGNPTGQKWGVRSISEFHVAYYQRTFTAKPEWKSKNVFLHFDAVAGLAEVFVNGRRVAWLPGAECADFDIGSKLGYGAENTVTVGLEQCGNRANSGISGSVFLRLLAGASLNDLAVRPSVEKRQISFACDVWNDGEPREAQLEFEISPASAPGQVVKRFVHSFRMAKADRGPPELFAQAQRVQCSFDWPDARLWTYDDPFLYRAQVRLIVNEKTVDTAPAVRFGFREFTMRKSEFLLNGVPTHLRGHQLGRANMEKVEELKPVGMNCFEFWWFRGEASRQVQLVEDILSFADEQGLVAFTNLPDASIIEGRILEPEVARLYQRRLDKDIRRLANHPSVCMWAMHFNTLGYNLYIAPSALDGSHKPTRESYLQRERYCLEAQRLAQAIDPLPLYHHSNGNSGDIYTLNCYLGPEQPLQEREDWPSLWAEKRPFPLITVEHCLILTPYWYRLRRFPLEDVYASEPLFEEFAAVYLGPRAYKQLTPEMFDIYTSQRKLWPHDVLFHPSYQEVKALVARRSLRAWRTYGVSGITFNAENWAYRDAQGKPTPVMNALARWFGDTDMYIAGPEGNWQSKDHAFIGGEKVCKQIVLLNDLTRDLPCALQWRLEDQAGAVSAQGVLEATARAGTPTFCPIECPAPEVKARTSFKLLVEPRKPDEHFKPESFALEVFPPATPPTIAANVLIYDPAGETARMLEQAHVKAQSLTGKSDLRAGTLLVVGKKSWDDSFAKLASELDLDRRIREGLNVLVFEQNAGSPFGLRLQERSWRDVFIATPGHPLLNGLVPEDLHDLRGESDLVEPYPDLPPEALNGEFPKRFYKWGNQGVAATFVYTKPHYTPFVPILECGFDLVESPLMEVTVGAGRVVLCQMDVTSRYGVDPISTQMVHNLLFELTRQDGGRSYPCACLGDSALKMLGQFGVATEAFDPAKSRIVVVGQEDRAPGQLDAITACANRGATILLLPGFRQSAALGLQFRDERFFIGRTTSDPLLCGVGDSDLYMKQWTTLPMIQPVGGWKILVQPGLLAVKTIGQGRILACQLDPEKLGKTRGRVKSLRFWNILLANLKTQRADVSVSPRSGARAYEPNEWEEMPRYFDW
jgi:hypothetical protein